MKSAEPDNKSCGDKTLLDFYEENYKRLEKCRDNKKWICEDDQWKCPNNKYDCNWTGPYAPKRITDMEHCEFGRKCGKFGPGRCYNGIRPPIKQKIQKLEPPPHNAEPDDLDELPIYFEPDSDEIPINFEDDEEEIDEKLFYDEEVDYKETDDEETEDEEVDDEEVYNEEVDDEKIDDEDESDINSDSDFEENTNIFDMSGIDKNELANISLPQNVNISDPLNLNTADMMKILEVL